MGLIIREYKRLTYMIVPSSTVKAVEAIIFSKYSESSDFIIRKRSEWELSEWRATIRGSSFVFFATWYENNYENIDPVLSMVTYQGHTLFKSVHSFFSQLDTKITMKT